MNEQNPNPVVVAVGHDPIDAALAFAAGEAGRAGCGLHLVHVVHHVAQGPEMTLVGATDVERLGRQTLDAALERARDLVEGIPVTAELRIGGVVPTLVDMAKDARMIVLERRDLSSMMRVVTRSVSSGVAARARVPVVSVPTHWSSASTHGDFPTVTVGIDVPERAEPVLRAAARRGQEPGRCPARPPHLELPDRLRRHHPHPDRERGVGGPGDRRDPDRDRPARRRRSPACRCRSRRATHTPPTRSSRQAAKRRCW